MTVKKIIDLTPEQQVSCFAKFFKNEVFRAAVYSLIIEGSLPNESEGYQLDLQDRIREMKRYENLQGVKSYA